MQDFLFWGPSQGFVFFRLVHMLIGVVVLATFWIPLVTKKGGKLHNSSGRIFLLAMAGTLTTSFALCILRLINPETEMEDWGMAAFLFYITIFIGAMAIHGMRALALRDLSSRPLLIYDKGLNLLVILSSLATSALGIFYLEDVLFSLFPLVGIYYANRNLQFLNGNSPQNYLQQHVRGMLLCVIATITAFLVTTAPLYHASYESLWIWFGPLLVFTPVMLYWNKKAKLMSSLSKGDFSHA